MNIKKLRIDNINKRSPYKVLQRDDRPDSYYFKSEYDIEFKITLTFDSTIVTSGAYMLDIVNATHKASPNDIKFRQTLTAIIEEFFEQNNDVMLYITETGDEKQELRNRLFVRWFNTYENNDCFFIRVADGKMEGQNNFMALLARRDNSRLAEVIEEFDETVALLFD